jgi:leader peptidase (prepilin peptidase)/N-methyltransferase
MIRVLGTVLAALLGLAFGSFLNVCLSRWPQGESIVTPRSHCRQCGRTLAWWENVPLVSWLALRGRCRTCGAWIGWRYVVVEAAVGGLWAIEAWRSLPSTVSATLPTSVVVYGASIGAFTMLFFWLLVALAMLDAEHYWLPNWLTLPGMVLGFLFVVAKEALFVASPFHDTVYGSEFKMMATEAGQAALSCVIAVVAAAVLILLIRWLYWLIRRREGLGLGDAKLMALLAAWLGFQGALLAFAVGVLLGALVALFVLFIPRRPSDEPWALLKLPLGTFLCIGGIVSALWAQPIIAAYRSWADF